MLPPTVSPRRPPALFAGRPDRAVTILSLAAAVATACGAETLPADAPPPATMALCDGSDRIRLLYTNHGGGPLPGGSTFYAAYGHAFLVIDGRCQYQAGNDYLQGVRGGTLDEAQASTIARQLHYGEYARLARETSPNGCPDASALTLSDGEHEVSCVCTCTTEGSADARQTFTNLLQIHMDLIAAGKRPALPLRVLATTDVAAPDRPAFDWPLSWSPADAVDDTRPPGATTGKLVTDPGDVAALVRLRDMLLAAGNYSVPLPIQAAGTRYDVYPRDELPTAVARVLTAAAAR
jgi:hypothetical protein